MCGPQTRDLKAAGSSFHANSDEEKRKDSDDDVLHVTPLLIAKHWHGDREECLVILGNVWVKMAFFQS